MSQEPTSQPMSPLQRYRPYNLRVTDLRDQMWCEKQAEFALLQGREETEAMRIGSERHQALHEEITEIIEVQPETREDHWALYLWNALAGLQLLAKDGLAREVPVFGQLEDIWVLGIIDEIVYTEQGTLQLLDTKTRKRPNLPRHEQKNATRLQMSLYYKLFHELATGHFDTDGFFIALKLNPTAPLSDELRQELCQQGFDPKNLQRLMVLVLEAFAQTPPLDRTLAVRYEWQEDHSLLGIDTFPYREEWTMRRVQYHLQYWRGERQATGVPPRERWKCKFCPFQPQCALSPMQTWRGGSQ